MDGLNGYLHDTDATLSRLGHALAKYFKQTDAVRVRFSMVKHLYSDLSKDLQKEMRRQSARNNLQSHRS